LKQHNFPVLVCVYHIIVDSETNLSAATSQTEVGTLSFNFYQTVSPTSICFLFIGAI